MINVLRETYEEMAGLIRMWDCWLLMKEQGWPEAERDEMLEEVSEATRQFCGSAAGGRMEAPLR